MAKVPPSLMTFTTEKYIQNDGEKFVNRLHEALDRIEKLELFVSLLIEGKEIPRDLINGETEKIHDTTNTSSADR